VAEKLKHNKINNHKTKSLLKKTNIAIQQDYHTCIKTNKNTYKIITMMIEYQIMLNIRIYNHISGININPIWVMETKARRRKQIDNQMSIHQRITSKKHHKLT
jgi:hypothetical protein